MSKFSLRLLIFLVPLALSSCTSWREADPVAVPTCPLVDTTLDADSISIIEKRDFLPGDWWNLFQDEQLTRFILRAFVKNPTLQQAHARILEASANAQDARSSLFPYIYLGGDIARQKLSETGVIPFGDTSAPVAGAIPIYFTQLETQLNLKYDFDLWKKNRNTYKAALGEIRARVADEIFARLELGISLASAYFQLQTDYEREIIARKLVENREKYQNYVTMRSKAGLSTATDINVTQLDVSDVLYALYEIEKEIALNEHQIKALLADDCNEEIAFTSILRQPLPTLPFPKDLPLRLIALRPDITAQLWLLESACLQVKVAKAGFYPDFNITAFFGFQTIHPKQLFRWASSYFNVNPGFTLPIFDGGHLLANWHKSEVNYDLEILKYNEMIYQAVREVMDGVSVLKNVERELFELTNKARTLESNLELTLLRLKNSVNSNLDYLTGEYQLLLAQDREIVAYGNTLQAILSLIKALGGGYESECEGP